MTTLGFRSDPKNPRYAIVSRTKDDALVLVNADDETKLVFPAGAEADEQKISWLYNELDRLLHKHPEITKVVVKKGEFTAGDNNAKRLASYQEATVLLFCALKGIPVANKIYASLSTNSSQVKDHAEDRVGKTAKYWDVKMADAVIAAWWSEKR